MLEPFDITHPALDQRLDGLTILHLSDFHVRWSLKRHRWWPRLLAAIQSVEVDLVALTGDYMDKPGHEARGLELLRSMAGAWRTRAGALAIHGNHDTIAFRALARELPDLRWIGGTSITLDLGPRGPLRVGGLDWPEDLPALLASQPARQPFDLVLAHVPTALIPLADHAAAIVLCGHTHAGQCRLSPRFAPHTSSDTPRHLAGGLLRYRDTLCAISRGVGDGVVEGLRINCPRQVGLFTLRRGSISPWTSTVPIQTLAW